MKQQLRLNIALFLNSTGVILGLISYSRLSMIYHQTWWESIWVIFLGLGGLYCMIAMNNIYAALIEVNEKQIQ